MKRTILLAAMALAACGPSTSRYEQTQQPVTPTGTIYVRVLDGNTLSPLAGVSAKVLGVDTPLTSGADGVIVLKNAVVLSSYLFILESPDYVRQLVSMTLPGTTGNSPLQNPVASTTVTMVKGDGEIKGVLLLPTGKPAANASVYVDQRQSGAGESIATATVGADGTFDLKGLGSRTTGMSHTVIAQWYDENGDGQADYSAFSSSVSVFTGSVARVFMTYGSLGQRIVATNVADAELPPGEDIKFTFALPILPSNLNGAAGSAFTLTDLNRNSVNVAIEPTYAADGVNVSIKPAGGAQLVAGDRYTIAGNVTQASAGGTSNTNATTNFSLSYTFQVRPSTVTPITSQVQNLTVWNPNFSTTVAMTQFNWNTNSFALAWDGVTGVTAYNVYAKDTNSNPAYVLVGSVTNNAAPRVQVTVSLPSAFDANPADGSNQPLSMKNKVTFAVVPVDAYGNWAPLSSAATKQVEDNVPPQTTANPLSRITPLGTSWPFNNYVDAINDDPANPSTLQFRVSYNEPMDLQSQPTFTGATAITASWVWEGTSGNTTSGILTLSIAAGGDGSGPFSIRGGKDMNGNVLVNADIVGSLSGMKELLVNGSFEDASGACQTNGWTLAHTSSMPDPTAVQGAASSGRCSVFVGAPAGVAAATGASRITQDVTLPSLPASTNWDLIARAWYRNVFTDPATGTPTMYQRCRLTDTAGAVQSTIVTNTAYFRDSSSNMSSYSYDYRFLSSGNFTGSVARFVCEADNTAAAVVNGGMYVDDLSLVLFKQGSI